MRSLMRLNNAALTSLLVGTLILLGGIAWFAHVGYDSIRSHWGTSSSEKAYHAAFNEKCRVTKINGTKVSLACAPTQKCADAATNTNYSCTTPTFTVSKSQAKGLKVGVTRQFSFSNDKVVIK